MNKFNKFLLIWTSLGTGAVLFFSLLSFIKLGTVGDGDPILTPLRILNTNVVILAFVVLSLIFYLFRKDKDR